MGLSAWMTATADNSQIQDGWVRIKCDPATKDAASMHYIKVGNGAPLLLLHGLLGSAYSWRYNMQELARTSTVYAVDLIGMGLSERVPGVNASLEATAARTIAFMDALGLDKADIAGTSHGGALALVLAAKYPNRVGKLILAAPVNPFSTEAQGLLQFYRASLTKWITPEATGHAEAKGQTGQLPSLPHSLPHTLQELAIGWMYGNPSRVSIATLENYMASLRVPYTCQHVIAMLDSWRDDMITLRQAIHSLRTKSMLLIWGDHDRSVELRSAEALKQHLPNAELVVLAGAGHIAHEEMPDEFNDAARNWLEHGAVLTANHTGHHVRPTFKDVSSIKRPIRFSFVH
jgi:pimeloyl-ACP methyl ester carboxylesterase